jgi:hypothetical protein
LGKWHFKLLSKDGVWQTSLRESSLARKCYPKWFGNLGIRIFGLAWWLRRSFSSIMVLSQ